MGNNLLREVDIELRDVVIQVKSGNARGLTGQMTKTIATTGEKVIGYAPDMPDGAFANALREGLAIARTEDDLLMILREFL